MTRSLPPAPPYEAVSAQQLSQWLQDGTDTVLLDFTDGVATLRLNRPHQGNAINPELAADLAEAATQISERPDVRAVLIAANGPNFTVGGDLSVFAETAREQLPNQLRRMIDSFHLAIERLTSIDAPIVAAVRGGAGGGGLGLLYAAVRRASLQEKGSGVPRLRALASTRKETRHGL